jgi:hypothetical protein
MPGQKEAGRARYLRGKAKTARGKRGINLDCGKRRDQRAALQPFFQSPSGPIGAAGFDDEKKGGIDAEREQARSIRASPFARGLPGQAPQQEFALRGGRACLLGDRRQGESERRGIIAIGLRPDLVQPRALELVHRRRGQAVFGMPAKAGILVTGSPGQAGR